MNTLKKAPLMAFVLGLGLMTSVVTMSSFKANRAIPNYSRNSATGVWSPLTTTPGSEPGEYRCSTGPSTYCVGYFSSPNPGVNATPTSDGVLGNFSINPPD